MTNDQLRERIIRTLEDQAVTFRRGSCVLEHGPERRKMLEFVADTIIADIDASKGGGRG